MGLQARLMSQALRKITPVVAKTDTVVIFLNQIRMKIGIRFGNPETTTGGNALKFYASVRLDIRRRTPITKDGEVIGHVREVKVVKNKVAPPFRTALFDLYFANGIDRASAIFEASVKAGVLEKAGSWYKYKGKQLGQGKEAVCDLLRAKPKLMEAIRQECLAKVA